MRSVKIPWDLEEKPLQIKTDSKLQLGIGEIEKISVFMYVKESTSYFSYVAVKFTSIMQYRIGYCTGNTSPDLPVQPPVEADKIWTFTKSETALIITCNNVEVLNYLFTDGSYNSCFPKWGVDVVEQILFHSTTDTASDFYNGVRGKNEVHRTFNS